VPLSAAVKIPTEGDNHYQKQVLVAVILSLVAVIMMVISATYAWTFWRKSCEALDSEDMKLQSEVLKLHIPENIVLFTLAVPLLLTS
jgi:heme/copper-type cytochrome/quinol oxidase subunit 2